MVFSSMGLSGPAAMTQVPLCGLVLNTGPFDSVADWLIRLSMEKCGEPAVVSHINLNNLYALLRDPCAYQLVARNCHLLFDGIGMKLGAFLCGLGWLPDLNGTDLFPLVMKKGSERGLRAFFLGGRPDAIHTAVKNVERQFSGVRIAGYHAGYFPSQDEDDVVDRIGREGADMLLVGRGFPLQEHFALRHRDRFNVGLIWNVGGLFDFVSGMKPRAPRIVRRARLEWLFRFLLEPKGMWRRNFVAAPMTMCSIVCRRARG